MRVQRVVMPNEAESWTVLGPDGDPVPPVEAFLAHLQALNRSPMTVRTYAVSLKLWLEFLARVEVGVDAARVEHVSRFVAWLRAPAENVIVFEGGQGRCSPVTVNRHLAALFCFYDYRARNGVVLAQSLVDWRRSNRGGYRPFLHHVTGGRPVPTRPLRLRQARRLPRTLTSEQIVRLAEAVSTCGTGSCWCCSPRPGCGSGRHWGYGTPTSSHTDASCGSCRARTT